jgi:hypothetical protein
VRLLTGGATDFALSGPSSPAQAAITGRTAKERGPCIAYEYLADVLLRIHAQPMSRIDELLLPRWRELRDAARDPPETIAA